MSTFRELLEENSKVNESAITKMYKKAKRFFTGNGEIEFIVPLHKGDKPVETRNKYELFVDWDEAVVIFEKETKKWDTMSIVKPLQSWAIKAARAGTPIIVEQDDKNDFYGFVSGIGHPDDVKDFINKELGGRNYTFTSWEF